MTHWVYAGAIVDLEVEAVGVHWVMLRWSLSPTVLELHKYSLLINEDITSEFVCTAVIPSKVYNIYALHSKLPTGSMFYVCAS